MTGSSIAPPSVPRPIRAVLAVAALLAVIWLVAGALLSYQRAASRAGTGPEATSTAAPSDQATGSGEATTGEGSEPEGEGTATMGAGVLVLVDGLNLREEPSTSARVIKRLKAGMRLLLVEEGEGWYRVRDVDGSEGWVVAGGSYTRLER